MLLPPPPTATGSTAIWSWRHRELRRRICALTAWLLQRSARRAAVRDHSATATSHQRRYQTGLRSASTRPCLSSCRHRITLASHQGSSRKEKGTGTQGSWRAERAYNGGLGADPPAGSRGRAPGRGPGGSWKPLSFWASSGSGKNALFSLLCNHNKLG